MYDGAGTAGGHRKLVDGEQHGRAQRVGRDERGHARRRRQGSRKFWLWMPQAIGAN